MIKKEENILNLKEVSSDRFATPMPGGERFTRQSKKKEHSQNGKNTSERNL